MEKWRSKGRCPLKADVDFPKNHLKNARPASPVGRKKTRKWSFGNFLRRKTKDASQIANTSTQTTDSMETVDSAIYCYPHHVEKPSGTTITSSQESPGYRDIVIPLSPAPGTESAGRNGRKNRLKLRIQAKREKYKSASSSDEEFPSNVSLLRIHSEDSLSGSKCDSLNQKRTRGARTERYMKRILTTADQNPLKNQLKYPSDILPSCGSPGAPERSRSYANGHSPFGSDSRIPSYHPRIIDNTCHDYKYESTNNTTPPEPPPRAFKLRLYPSTMRYSLQHSDLDTPPDFRSNSLDRRTNFNVKNRSPLPIKDAMEQFVRPRRIEEPIVPQLQPRHILSKNARNAEDERRRHSKNLEEALEELETIYNSLRLSDEDLLDRAEQRSMEEYRDKVAITAINGSIAASDTSSSVEITQEVAWRDAADTDSRLRDDMAYRRMHQHERPASVDNFGSMTQMSYLASSPCLSWREETPRSRRGTPDLTRDDVVFRSISHANNTLRIADPQPPFGIPLGPVTAAADSDYLHVVPQRDPYRSLYIPKREPDVVTDDLAFRSLRKDGKKISQSPAGDHFLPRNSFASEVEGKRAVRSLSADLYGIINKDSKQSSWYRKYVRLNRPLRVSGMLEAGARRDVDINGNKPTESCEGKVQVHIPHKETVTNGRSLGPELNEDRKVDDETSEYTELCRELENLIKKTSEKVKLEERTASRNSLTEFVEWEALLSETVTSKDGDRGSGGSEGPEGIEGDAPGVIGETVDGEVGKEADLPTFEEVPHVSVSTTAHCEPPAASPGAEASDGGSESDAAIDKFEINEHSNDSGKIDDDKIHIASKDNGLDSGRIDIASMIEGRNTAL
ncbi:uncharacterized protein LOC135162292 isoform X2 [Diachasmimorpha longicaudata]|uniref:uncharacterized protein LOC135162292 isoform X2 n=1 Tax=Diachasmimorpha longicaudata TaxID=58733 RepID=UPI0030B8CC3B